MSCAVFPIHACSPSRHRASLLSPRGAVMISSTSACRPAGGAGGESSGVESTTALRRWGSWNSKSTVCVRPSSSIHWTRCRLAACDGSSVESASRPCLVSFCCETHEKPYFRYTGGEALGVRQRSCRLSQYNYNQTFKGGSFTAALQGALRALLICNLLRY